jgi:hypothetical protein
MPEDIKKLLDKKKVTGIDEKNFANVIGTGVHMQPTLPYKPTQKSQQGNFSRRLPSFNSIHLDPDNPHPFFTFIGAKNPYAMINRQRIIDGLEPVDWDTTDVKQSTDMLLEFLNRGSKKSTSTLTIEQCFDPVYKSRIFPSKDVIMQAMAHSMLHLELAHPTNSYTTTGFQDKPCVQNPTWVNSTVNWPPAGISYNAPVQGTGCNCWLIAAISSIAWTDNTYFLPNDEGIFVLMENPAYTPQENLDASFIYPDNSLPLRSNGTPASTDFAWSTSKNKDKSVPMLERAYAMRLKYPASDPPQNDHPDICTCFGPGSPTCALYHLLGDSNYKQFINKTADKTGASVTIKWFADNDPLTPVVPGPGNGTLWDWLANKNCLAPVNPPATNIFRKTAYPTVAFTYGTQDPLIAGAQIGTVNTAYPAPKGSGVKYNTDLFVASHSYSILGTYSRGAVNYVLLRNPWGQIRTINQTMAATYGIDANVKVAGFTNDLWVPVTVNGVTSNMVQDGVFGLEFNKFALYFRGLAWV